MTAVWQTLIPETPSTEPIAPLLGPSPPRTPNTDISGLSGPDDELTAVITSSGSGAHGQYLCPPNHNVHHQISLGNHSHSSGGTRSTGSSPAGLTLSIPTSAHQRNANALLNHNQLYGNSNSNSKDSKYHKNQSFLPSRLSTTSSTEPDSPESEDGNRRGWLRAQFSRFYSERTQLRKKYDRRKRLFLKGGEWNTSQVNVFEKGQRFFGDIFTTLVDAQWRWTLFVFSFSYVMSWIIFAIIWWIILIAHGDIEHYGEKGWEPCVEEVKNFASVFLFSVETQHTIGYGHHRMTDNCTEAVVTLCLQSIAGVLIEAFMVGVVFAKLSRPKKRSETLAFSQTAVICQRDGKLHLMFRVGDLRNKSHILEAHVRAQIITKKITPEGEVIPIHQEEIKVGSYGEDEDRILLFWPTLILHTIDEESPFYSMTPDDLLKAKLELLVVLEGVVESTGMTTQARTSYLPNEILWGHRFQNLTEYKTERGQHVFDFDLFHATFPVETPFCSARDLDCMTNSIKLDGGSDGGIRDTGLAGSASFRGNQDTISACSARDGDDDGESNYNNNNIKHHYSRVPGHDYHRHTRSGSNSSASSNKSTTSSHRSAHAHAQIDRNQKKLKTHQQEQQQQQGLSSNIELSMLNSAFENIVQKESDSEDEYGHDDHDHEHTRGMGMKNSATANTLLLDKAPLFCNNDYEVDDDDDHHLGAFARRRSYHDQHEQLITSDNEHESHASVDIDHAEDRAHNHAHIDQVGIDHDGHDDLVLDDDDEEIDEGIENSRITKPNLIINTNTNHTKTNHNSGMGLSLNKHVNRLGSNPNSQSIDNITSTSSSRRRLSRSSVNSDSFNFSDSIV